MTTRLKVLSGLLLLSIIYAAVTSIFDSRETKNRNTVSSKNATSLAKTSAQKSKETDDIVVVNNYKSFKTINNENTKMNSWGSNPFLQNIIKKNPTKRKSIDPVELKNNLITSQSDYLNIESVAVIGETKIVIINGDRYREGEVVNNMFIEKIERGKITFRSGKTRIIKNVGT